jgi:ABC-type sulfate transport system permease subunit
LITLIDLPFAISPVVTGLMFVLLSASKAISVRGWRRTTSRSFFAHAGAGAGVAVTAGAGSDFPQDINNIPAVINNK